ncbi:MAG: LytTR family DNA-binding domain-containing protein [Gemmatimonadota bacterium]
MPENRSSCTVLIVEDEPLGCARLVDLLAEYPDVEVVGVADDADAAVEAIRTLRPELVFLDIQMPRGTGLDVVREIGPESMPVTVFVTAYDEYAVEAFRLAAVDYLLKPYSDERFDEAFQRARRKVKLEDLEKLRDKLLTLLGEGADTDDRRGERYLDRIAVQSRGQMRVVPVDEIDYIRASGVYAEIHVGSERHLIREALQALEEQLDPRKFFRIHRSSLVRLDRVEVLLRGRGGDYRVQLKSGVKLRVGRSRRGELEERLGRL